MLEKTPTNEAEFKPVLAQVMFASAKQLRADTLEAVNNGSLAVERIYQTTDGNLPDRTTFVRIPEDSFIKEPENPSLFAPDQATYKNPEDIAQKEAASVTEAVYQSIAWNDGSYLDSPLVGREIQENSTIYETYMLSNGASDVPLINFTSRKLQPEDLERIGKGLQALTDKTSPETLAELKAVCIHEAERFSTPDTVGSMQGSSAIMSLSEKLFDGSLDHIPNKFSSLGTDKLTNTVTHELAHLLEIRAKEKNGKLQFAKDVGWIAGVHELTTDDYGQVVRGRNSLLRGPNKTKIDEDGVEISTVKSYGAEAYVGAKPTTEYGLKDEREDFAEASVNYAHGTRANLDPIRWDTLEEYFSTLRTEGAEPAPIFAQQVDPEMIHFGHITPNRLLIKVTYAVEVPQPKWTISSWGDTTSHIVDDYGNEVRASKREVRRR